MLERLPGTVGLVGRHALCEVSGDIYFMSHSGVFKISQIFQNTPQPNDVPSSDFIKPVIDSINWNASNLICCGYRRDRVYFAIPLKNSIRNNCLIVYNITTGFWESIDTWGDPDFRCDDIFKMDYNGERRLFMVDRAKGLIVLMEEGKTDILGSTYDFEYQIDTSVMLRGYGTVKGRNRFPFMEMDIASWNPELTVTAYQTVETANIGGGQNPDRTKYRTFATPRWNPLNSRRSRSTSSAGLLRTTARHDGIQRLQIERQETTERYPVNLMGRYTQFKVENSAVINVRTVTVDSYEEQREPRDTLKKARVKPSRI